MTRAIFHKLLYAKNNHPVHTIRHDRLIIIAQKLMRWPA